MKRNRLIAGFAIAAFLLMAVSPLFVQAQTNIYGNEKTGVFVDEIVYDVITQDDQQVLALQDDEIDLIGDMVDPSFLDTLSEAEEIEVANVLRNGYGYITINTAKYPFNITAFRRALAFAMDKEAISDDVWDGLSVPQDSCVAQVNPFSIEGQLPYTYYEANVVLGNQLLDEAGFLDIDNDGFREAPNGDDFDVLVECASSSNIAIEVGEITEAALTALSIEANSVSTDFFEYLARLNYHGDYDIVFLGVSFTTFDVNWIAYSYWSEYADEPFFNFANFQNASYDAWRDQLLHATEYEDVLEAALEMQKIWIYECPQIICYENILLSAYRTDRFDGWVNSPIDGVPGSWTNYKVHLKEELGGPFGGTLRWSNPLDIETFNIMVATSAYAANILNMLYDSLMTPGPDGLDVNILAESYTIETHDDNPNVPDGYSRITFDIIQNATWSDGKPLTAEDVAFSMNYYRDSSGNPVGANLNELTAAYAPTPYTVILEFGSESYWHLHVAGYKPILPKHIFEEIGLDGWNTWNPTPPDDPMVTSGPYNVSEYIAGEFTELTYNSNYFFAADRSAIDTGPDDNVGSPDFTLAIVAGAVGAAVVILVGGYILMRNR
ncbi:MAG: ABC transporter substrate-binding protein [Candidatus Thorarchaeota archaeon]|jgi:ABC-type transport system substrate-binding protein